MSLRLNRKLSLELSVLHTNAAAAATVCQMRLQIIYIFLRTYLTNDDHLVLGADERASCYPYERVCKFSTNW
jgi:hypothetical protein